MQQIALLIIDQHKQKPWLAGDSREPVDSVLGLIADESVRVAARRLLDQRRFSEVVRAFAWQGILAPNNAPNVECDLDDEDEDKEEIPFDDEMDDPDTGSAWDNAADRDHGRPGPPSVEDISRILERLGQLNLLNNE